MALKEVKSGEPFKPSAELTNATIKVIQAHNSFDLNKTKGKPLYAKEGEIFVGNDDIIDFEVFAPVEISGLITDPLTDDNVFRQKAYKVKKPTSSTGVIAILQQPLDAKAEDVDGKIVRAMVIGTSPAKVNISSSSHKYADIDSSAGGFKSADSGKFQIIWRPDGAIGSQWCTLLLGGGGVAAANGTVLAQVTGGNSVVGYQVAIYANGKGQNSTGTGVVFLTESHLNMVAIPAGTWLCVHPAAVSIMGG